MLGSSECGVLYAVLHWDGDGVVVGLNWAHFEGSYILTCIKLRIPMVPTYLRLRKTVLT